jgi:hypothetical protein
MATLWTGRDMSPLVLQWFCSTCVSLVDVVASASYTHARASCLGHAVPHARLQQACWVRLTPLRAAVSCAAGGHGLGRRASQSRRVRAGAWSLWGKPSVVRGRPCTADGRGAHRAQRCPMEVGAPAPQDGDAAGVWTMSRRPRTEISPWSVALWSPLCPNRAVTPASTSGACEERAPASGLAQN